MAAKIIINQSAVAKLYATEGKKYMDNIADSVVRVARSYVAVRSGALKDSIQAENTKDGVMIGSELPYAMKEEFRQPYLRPALMTIISNKGGR